MKKIFKRKAEEKVDPASAPEEPESPGEIKHTEELSNTDKDGEQPIKYVEVPVYMSQDQLNNMTIETNMIVKEILSRIESRS